MDEGRGVPVQPSGFGRHCRYEEYKEAHPSDDEKDRDGGSCNMDGAGNSYISSSISEHPKGDYSEAFG